MNALGLLYLNIKWFEPAAENKSMYGYFNQARMYEEGLGVESSPAKALCPLPGSFETLGILYFTKDRQST